MNINYVECICPHCGAVTKEPCNTWAYGSPIKTCNNCNYEYIDERFTEVAISGFDKRSSNPSFYLKCTLGFLIASIIFIASMIYLINNKGFYPNALLGCVLASVLGTIGSAFLYIRIKLGYDDKKNAQYLEESRQRLSNKEYVYKLIEYGYEIPDIYK